MAWAIFKTTLARVSASRNRLQGLRFGGAYWTLFRELDDWQSICILFLGVVCAIGAGIPLPLMAVVFRGLIESFPPPDAELNPAIHYILAIASAYFILTWIWTVSWGLIGGRISRRLQESLVERVLGLDMEFFDTETFDLSSTLTSDTQTIQRGTSEKVGLFLQSISYFVATFVTGFVLSPPLTGVLFAAIFPAMFILVSVGSSMVSRNAKQASHYTDRAASAAEQAIKAVEVVQAFGAIDALSGSHARLLDHAAHYAFRKTIASAVMLASIFFVCYSTNALAFYWGAELGGSSGTIYAVVFLVLDASFVFTQVGPFIQTIAMASSAGEKILGIIRRPASQINPYTRHGRSVKPADFDNDIVCHDLSFAYPVRKGKQVLRGVNLTFRPGSSTGIVGPSGSGKSSLTSLLIRLYDPSAGEITLGATNLTEFNLKDYRSHIALVDQEPVLFSGTILDNIRHGIVDAEKLTDQDIRARCTLAAQAANADFIESLADGIDSQVGSSGDSLSGGQRQRICLARALVRRPRILILDEPTSALDSTSESKILDALRDYARTGCTILMIAHRLSTVKDMDSIVVIADGRVQEQGSHQELLAKSDGVYKALVDAQNVTPNSSPGAGSGNDDDCSAVPAVNTYAAKRGQMPLKSATQVPVHIPGSVPVQESGSVPGQIMDAPVLRPSSRSPSLRSKSTGVLVEQPEDASSWQLLKRCIDLNNGRENVLLVIGLTASGIMGALIIYEAIVFGHLVTILQSNEGEASVLGQVRFFCLMFLIISIIALLASGTSNSCFGVVSELLLTRIRDRALRTVLRQDQLYFQKPEHSAHRLVASISSDSNHIAGLTGSIIATVFSVCVNIVAGIAVALVFAWKIALVLLALVPAIVVAGYLRVTMLARFEKKHHESFKHAAALASEAVQNIRTVSAFGREQAVLHQYKAAIAGPYKQNFWYCVFGDLALTMCYSIVFFAYALAYWWGSEQVRDGYFTRLDFFTMLPAFLLTAQQSGQLFSAAPEILQARTAARRLFKLLDEEPTIMTELEDRSRAGIQDVEPKVVAESSASSSQHTLASSPDRTKTDAEPHKRRSSPGSEKRKTNIDDGQSGAGNGPSNPSSGASVTLSHVSLAYPSAPSSLVLDDVSLHIPRGSTIGLVGPSGAGKSSLISLLERFYDPTMGSLAIDGVDVRQCTVNEHRSRLSYVPQEPSLFEGTVSYNIELGSRGLTGVAPPTREDVEQVCKHYNLHTFISSLPEGYDTEVGTGGGRLSGGQKQRLALARALIRRPKILILDEATSALDAHSEQEVQEILEQIKAEGRTVIMIAHRMSTVKDADEIVVLEQGRVVEKGNHTELMQAGGVYERMIRAQDLA